MAGRCGGFWGKMVSTFLCLVVALMGSAGAVSVGGGSAAFGSVLQMYLSSLNLMAGEAGFKGLTREDVNWLMERTERENRSSLIRTGGTSDRVVRDFLCTRRSLQQFCGPPQLALPDAARMPETAERQQIEGFRKLRIGTKDCNPFVYCTNEEGRWFNSTDPDKMTGYSIDFLDKIAEKGNFEYEIECRDSVPTLIENTKDGRYDLSVACISVLSSRLSSVTFSRVYYYSGLEVMIMKPEESGKRTLSMLDPFTWEVWVCVLLTIMTVGVFLWLFEREKNTHMKRKAGPGIMLGQWHAWTTFLNNPFINYRSWPARLTVFAFLLVSLVIVATYTANLAAFLTRRQFNTSIQGFNDLQGRLVGTSAEGTSAYEFLKAQHSINVRPFQDNNELVRGLEEKKIDAIVWDSPQLRYHAHQDCDKALVGETFNPEDYAIALKLGDEELWSMFDNAIVELKEERVPEALYEQWFEDIGRCTVTLVTEEVSETEPVSLESTWVLFVFQLGVLAIALVVHCTPKVWNWCGFGEQSSRGGGSSEDASMDLSFVAKDMQKSTAELSGTVPIPQDSLSNVHT